jgi:hypothetical protein
MAGLVHGSIDMDGLERRLLSQDIRRESAGERDVRDAADDSGADSDGAYCPDGYGERAYDYNPEVERLASNPNPNAEDKSGLSRHRPTGGRSRGRQGGPSVNTGPKGVKADYAEYQVHQEAERRFKAAERSALIERLVAGAKTDTPSISHSAQQARDRAARTAKRGARRGDSGAGSGGDDYNDDDDDSSDDDEGFLDDEDFMEEYRNKRRAEFQRRAKLPAFGKVTTLDALTFVDRVEAQAGATVFMVVHLCEDAIKVCRRIDAALEALAKEHVHVDFVRLRKSDTPSGLPCSAVPSFLVYRGGELATSVMKVADKIGEKCSKDDVEWLLAEEGVLGMGKGLEDL